MRWIASTLAARSARIETHPSGRRGDGLRGRERERIEETRGGGVPPLDPAVVRLVDEDGWARWAPRVPGQPPKLLGVRRLIEDEKAGELALLQEDHECRVRSGLEPLTIH